MLKVKKWQFDSGLCMDDATRAASEEIMKVKGNLPCFTCKAMKRQHVDCVGFCIDKWVAIAADKIRSLLQGESNPIPR